MQRIFKGFLISAVVCLLCSNVSALVPLRVVVFGDSLTSGYDLQPEENYAAKLDRKLKEIGYQSVEVDNMSVAEATTSDAVEKLPAVMAKHPDIVVIEFGVNDAQRGINIPLINSNLEAVVNKLSQDRVFIILMGIKNLPGVGYAYSGQLEGVYSGITTLHALHFYPDALQGINGNPDLTLADGYHPNTKGVDMMVENTFRMVDEGLRYKWSVQQFQEYQQQLNNSTPGANR